MKPYLFSSAVLSSLLVLLSCSSKDDDDDSGSQRGGSAGAPSGGGAGTGGTGGAANTCPEDPGIMTCGSETCSEVEPSLAAICVRNCCTSDMKCGTQNGIGPTACMPKLVDESMCPMTTVFGMSVSGCCVPNQTLCGVQDVSGLFGGGCVPRCSLATFQSGITNVNCADGTPAGECSTAGNGGMGGGNAGTGGAGGSAGN
jgi:hypothetical protein